MIFEDNKDFSISFLHEIKDGEGVRVFKKFLQNVAKNFIEESLSFYQIWGEMPFIYGEKQLNSILAPSIHKITNNVWFEQPFKNYDKDQRFLDIATTEKDNIYLIELKHYWNSKTDKIVEKAYTRWREAINQIKDINRKTIYGYFNYEDCNVFKIALMIMPTYISSHENHKILNLTSEKYCNNLFDKFKNDHLEKDYKANFCITIKINKQENYIHEYIDGKLVYPYITFIGRVERVSKI